MTNWKEMTDRTRWVLSALVLVSASAALYYFVYGQLRDANQTAELRVQSLQIENVQLEQFRPRLTELDAQIAGMQVKLEAGRRVVPDEKETAQLMHLLEAEAHQSGVDIRRYTARAVAQRDYYAEVPFELELDGNYFALRSFFERVSHLDRIVNISALLVASTRNPQDARTKRTYSYSPGESVVATCVATAFYAQAAPVVVPPGGTSQTGLKN